MRACWAQGQVHNHSTTHHLCLQCFSVSDTRFLRCDLFSLMCTDIGGCWHLPTAFPDCCSWQYKDLNHPMLKWTPAIVLQGFDFLRIRPAGKWLHLEIPLTKLLGPRLTWCCQGNSKNGLFLESWLGRAGPPFQFGLYLYITSLANGYDWCFALWVSVAWNYIFNSHGREDWEGRWV